MENVSDLLYNQLNFLEIQKAQNTTGKVEKKLKFREEKLKDLKLYRYILLSTLARRLAGLKNEVNFSVLKNSQDVNLYLH
jgi:hypothetical protein